ncbi:MAG: hypothetical protein OXB94_13220 [Nitrospira sp.]|nr:hypothetical protein [Nitrospira sp.]
MKQLRPLTHDEKKAAEAAYRGRAFDASWSQAARAVYDGILTARGYAVDAFDSDRADREAAKVFETPETLFSEAMGPARLSGEQNAGDPATARHAPSRQEAIEAGLLVDVTKKAKRIGFDVAVGITKSLWDRNITKSLDLDPHEWDLRVRDMLLAVRLRMAGQGTSGPWVEVPVVFPSTQGEEPPQMFSIYALFHKDPVAEDCVTLIHRNEFSSIMRLSSSHSETGDNPSFDSL